MDRASRRGRSGSRITCAAALIGLCAGLPAVNARAASFTPGNLVVYRVGDGVEAPSALGNAVFLDEYTSTGTLVQSIALPTGAGSPPQTHQLVADGTASGTNEGLLTTSTDGQYVLLTGYAVDRGVTTLGTSACTTAARTVGRVKYDGTVDTTTALTDLACANNPRSATSTDGVEIWAAGASGSTGGAHFLHLGDSTSTQLVSIKGARQVTIFDGQLYMTDNQPGNANVEAVGTGVPTTAGQTLTKLPGLPDSSSPAGFFFASLPGGTVLYVADDTAGNVQKYSLVGGTWTANGSVTLAGAHGLIGTVGGTTVHLYVTDPGTLSTFDDTSGFDASIGGTPTALATAPTNEGFRGVTLAPVMAAPATPTPTVTATPTPSSTSTTTPTATATETPVVATPTVTAVEPTTTATIVVATATATPLATATSTATATQIPTATPSVTATPTAVVTPIVQQGFVPPDKHTAKCEDAVAKNLGKLAACVRACHAKQVAAALKAKPFDEEECETGAATGKSCRAKYDKASQALLAKADLCPPCLDVTAQGTLADSIVTALETEATGVYCGGATPLDQGGDDGGKVPPDKATAKCEGAVAKGLGKLAGCVGACEIKQADVELKGKAFGKAACETGAPKSCRGKYDTASAALDKSPICPACLDPTARGTLADTARSVLEQNQAQIYCAGTVPLQ